MSKAKILIVDDEPDVRDSVRFRMEMEDGYEVLTASNGLEALGAARVHKPEVILLDVMMPGENGYRVAAAIRDDEAAGVYPARATIILLTARDLSNDPERERMFLQFSQADDVIYKPFDLEVVVERVAEHIAGLTAA